MKMQVEFFLFNHSVKNTFLSCCLWLLSHGSGQFRELQAIEIMIYKVYNIYYLDLYKSKNKKTKDSYSRPFKV